MLSIIPMLDNVVVYDSFNRADSSVSMGTADTGQVWQYAGSAPSNWGIHSGKAYLVATPDSINHDATVNAKVANCIVRTRITYKGASAGLSIREQDVVNHFAFRIFSGNLSFFRVIGGTATAVGSWPITTNNGQDYELMVICNGNTFRLFLDGVEKTVSPIVDSTYPTQTFFGLRSVGANSADYDYFSVEAL